MSIRKTILFLVVAACIVLSAAFSAEDTHAVSLKDKTVLIEGDSIQTEANGAFLFNTASSMGAKKIVNKSEKHATLAYDPKSEAGKNSVWYRFSKMSKKEIKKYDVFLISAGSNDWSKKYNIDLGDYAQNDPKTFCGAANSICDRIWKYNSKARIIFFSPIYRYKNGSKKEDCDKVKNKYGKTLMDYRIGLFNAAAFHEADIVCGDQITKKKEAKDKKCLKDFLHPTKKYAKTIAKRAGKEIKKIK